GKSLRLRLPGEAGERPWRYASRAECSLCHNFQGAGAVLGAGTLQLNREVERGGRRENQLRSLERLGLFLRPLSAAPEALPRLVDPHDASGDLARRARSYLHANCTHCHDENRGGLSPLRLKFSSSEEAMAALGAPPLQGGFGLEDARLIAPGDPSRSVLYYRLAKMGSGHMPRVGPKLVDPRGLALVREWIEGLPGERGAVAVEGDAVRSWARAIEAAGSPPEARAQAIGALLDTTRGALELAHRLGSGGVSEECRSQALSTARAHPRFEVRDLFLRFLLREGEVPEAREADPGEILALRGDAARGREIFFRDGAPGCKGCHAAGGRGAAVGPDLSHIGKKYPRTTLLAQLVDPSREVSPEYAAYLLLTTEGEVLSGLLSERSESEVALKDMQGRVRRVPARRVKSLDRQPLSLMPDALLRELTAQEAADLLEYLVTRRAGTPAAR
ncbi:MAG: c-type cytochrome, partial [Thermoanaerobaculia bacterium]